MKKLILGPGPKDEMPAEGPRRVFAVAADEWNQSQSYGVLRLMRLALVLTADLKEAARKTWAHAQQQNQTAKVVALKASEQG